MHHHRIDGGLLKQNDVAGKLSGEFFLAHGMAAVLDDDGFIVVLLHMRQRFRQDTGLILRADIHRQIDHGKVSFTRAGGDLAEGLADCTERGKYRGRKEAVLFLCVVPAQAGTQAS